MPEALRAGLDALKRVEERVGQLGFAGFPAVVLAAG